MTNSASSVIQLRSFSKPPQKATLIDESTCTYTKQSSIDIIRANVQKANKIKTTIRKRMINLT